MHGTEKTGCSEDDYKSKTSKGGRYSMHSTYDDSGEASNKEARKEEYLLRKIEVRLEHRLVTKVRP